MAKSFKSSIPVDSYINPADEIGSTSTGDRLTERMTVIFTESMMNDLKAISAIYEKDGIKIDGRKPTTNKLVIQAVQEYIKKHAAEIERYNRM